MTGKQLAYLILCRMKELHMDMTNSELLQIMCCINEICLREAEDWE